MIIITKRSRVRYLFDVLLTTLGWVLFVYLFGAGILNILKGRTRGPDAPFLPPELIESFGTLAGYTLLMLIFAAIFIVWFQYNEHFGKYGKYGRYRRQETPALSHEQLRRNLEVTPAWFSTAQTARVMRVQHDDEGRIVGVEAVTPASRPR